MRYLELIQAVDPGDHDSDSDSEATGQVPTGVRTG
jgi:hypothetical protein